MQFELKLYVAGHSPVSAGAVAAVEQLQNQLHCEIALEIVDILQRPEVARRDRIIATPVLIRTHPLPVRKMVGDLSDLNRVVVALQIGPEPDSLAHDSPETGD